jgi:hypothetical protein
MVQQQGFAAAGATFADYMRDIRACFPSLAHLPDTLLASQPLDALCRLAREEKAASSKVSKNLEQRAQQNAVKAAENPEEVAAGLDNRTSILHEARYLAGATVTLQQHWHAARLKWGQEGVDTLLNYDMRALGHAGCVTARGWDALHHPGSANITARGTASGPPRPRAARDSQQAQPARANCQQEATPRQTKASRRPPLAERASGRPRQWTPGSSWCSSKASRPPAPPSPTT